MMNSFRLTGGNDDSAVSAADGSETAFQNIWERFNLPVKKFIYDMCGNYDLTDDLAQETFVRIFKGIGGFRAETKFSTWVFGIAKNVVFENFRRTKNNNRFVEIEHVHSFAAAEEKSSPEHSVIESEMREAVYKKLDELAPEQRISFVLRVFHGKSHAEIAEITGFGIPKIKVDIYRTRLKLRKQLSAFMEANDEV